MAGPRELDGMVDATREATVKLGDGSGSFGAAAELCMRRNGASAVWLRMEHMERGREFI